MKATAVHRQGELDTARVEGMTDAGPRAGEAEPFRHLGAQRARSGGHGTDGSGGSP